MKKEKVLIMNTILRGRGPKASIGPKKSPAMLKGGNLHFPPEKLSEIVLEGV